MTLKIACKAKNVFIRIVLEIFGIQILKFKSVVGLTKFKKKHNWFEI